MRQDLSFFSTGNSRNLGTSCSIEAWRLGLQKIDQFIHTSNVLSLVNNDIIFSKTDSELKVYREISGFVSKHELTQAQLFCDDAHDRFCAAKKMDIPYETELLKIFSIAQACHKELQHTEFPEKYGQFNHFELRLRMDFKTIDQLKTDWFTYMFFDRGSSSILTF